MSFLNFGKKNKVEEGFTESFFECTRDSLTIRGTEYRPEGRARGSCVDAYGWACGID